MGMAMDLVEIVFFLGIIIDLNGTIYFTSVCKAIYLLLYN